MQCSSMWLILVTRTLNKHSADMRRDLVNVYGVKQVNVACESAQIVQNSRLFTGELCSMPVAYWHCA